MKKLLIFWLSMFCLASCTDKKDSDHNDILKVLEDQRQAWNRGDLDGYMEGYIRSDSLVFVGKNGPKYGWKTTLENYRKGYPNQAAMGFLTFDIKKVKLISADHAFILGGWHLKREKDAPQGYFTLLMKKIDGKWKVIADHSS